MIVTLFERPRSETYYSLFKAADAAKDWYSDLGEDAPPWEHKKRVAAAVADRDDYYPRPRLTVICIEATAAEAH